MKITLNTRWLQAGVASLFLSTGLAYGDLVIAWPADSVAAWSTGQGTPPNSMVTDATIPAGLGTQAMLWGNGVNNFQQMYYSVGSAIGSQNISSYTTVEYFVLPSANNAAGNLQPVLQGTVNGYMQPSLSPTITSLANGWKEVTYSLSDPNFTDKAAIYSIGVGFYDGSTTATMEIGGIVFTSPVPEPSSLALLAFGAVALGLTTWNRRKVVS